MESQQNLTSHDELATRIYEISGHKIDPDSSADLWTYIQQHKWVLSEKIGRDVGLKVAALDYIENISTIFIFY